jgi:hypothetical protein
MCWFYCYCSNFYPSWVFQVGGAPRRPRPGSQFRSRPAWPVFNFSEAGGHQSAGGAGEEGVRSSGGVRSAWGRIQEGAEMRRGRVAGAGSKAVEVDGKKLQTELPCKN